jgi:hypothetical protein
MRAKYDGAWVHKLPKRSEYYGEDVHLEGLAKMLKEPAPVAKAPTKVAKAPKVAKVPRIPPTEAPQALVPAILVNDELV